MFTNGQQPMNELANPKDVIVFKKNIKRAKKILHAPLNKDVIRLAVDPVKINIVI